MAIKKKNFTKDEAKQMHYLFECGLTLGDIARRWNTDPNYVRAAIQPMLKKPDSDEPQGTDVKLEFTEAEVKQILQLKNNGHSYEDIAARSGSIPEVIRNVVKNNKALFNQLIAEKAAAKEAEPQTPTSAPEDQQAKSKTLTKEEIAKIVEYRKAGFSLEEMAKDMGRSQSAISSAIAKLKAENKLDGIKHISEEESEKIVQAYMSGRSISQIARDLHRAQSSISRAVERLKAEGRITITPSPAAPAEEAKPIDEAKPASANTPKVTINTIPSRMNLVDEKRFSEKDIEEISERLSNGESHESIRKEYNIVCQSTMDILSPVKNENAASNSIHRFPPRQLIKHLYDLGYRIENDKLVLIRKVEVNIDEIINE